MITVVVEETRHVVEVGNPNTVVVAEPQIDVVEIPTQITVVIPQIITNIVEVEPGVPNPTLIFKTADETNTTTSFTNDDELHFEVVEGSKYTFRASVVTDINNDTNTYQAAFDVPTDVDIAWRQLREVTGLTIWSLDTDAEQAFETGSGLALLDVRGTIDATLNGGTVTFQFRNPDGNTSGGVTVKAGSFIELFRVN